MSPRDRTRLLAPAGLVVGPALWAVSTQAGQILPYLSCGQPWYSPALLAFPAALASAAAGWVSWRTARAVPAPAERGSGHPGGSGFMGRLSALSALFFAYALFLQGLSSVLLTGCER